ncbi:hypothetical protein GCM10028792_21400 [Salinisphaera aquimarina]
MEDRQARQRAGSLLVDGRRLFACALFADADQAVERAVVVADTAQKMLGQLGGAHAGVRASSQQLSHAQAMEIVARAHSITFGTR